jgi:hypothetical protein
LQANNFEHSYIENLGGGKFRLHPLPVASQLAPLYGLVIDDFNTMATLTLRSTEMILEPRSAMAGMTRLMDCCSRVMAKAVFRRYLLRKAAFSFLPMEGRW